MKTLAIYETSSVEPRCSELCSSLLWQMTVGFMRSRLRFGPKQHKSVYLMGSTREEKKTRTILSHLIWHAFCECNS